MKKIELVISNISNSISHNNSYALLLSEVRGKRKLPIIVGTAEAQAIAVAIDNIQPPRPLTHDLIKNMFDAFDIILTEVNINNLFEGVFFSKLICLKDGDEITIDSRTSDALAIAIRFGCPIYTNENIMSIASILIEEATDIVFEDEILNSNAKEQDVSEYYMYTNKELESMLKESLESENYEKAAHIRDELSKRKV